MYRLLPILGGLLIALPCMADSKPSVKKPSSPGFTDAQLEARLNMASVSGKYRMLLHQFEATEEGSADKVIESGLREVREYAGHKDLPKGYWVHVAPYWYIWREESKNAPAMRGYGPEQAEGEPNTPDAGDIPTAWASQTPDGQDEWLLCEYAEPMSPKAVVVHETYNPGSVEKITAFKLNGEEVIVWKGKDPTPTNKPHGISIFPIKLDFKTNRIKLHISSREVPGWNEIDAVALRDKDNKDKWAKAVASSTTFAQPVVAVPVAPRMANPFAKINELENELKKLKEDIAAMKASMEELKRLLKEKK